MLRKIITTFLTLVLLITALPPFESIASAEMPYYITVDITNQIVSIYSTSDGSLVRQMLCSTGLKDSTPTGTFTLPKIKREGEREEWFRFSMYDCYAHYATRIYMGVMFHSIPYNKKNEATISKKAIEEFGRPASHGCIRLRTEDAKFIAKYCLAGTKCKIYKSNQPQPELRELLLASSYTNENGMTYRDFLGISDIPGVMGCFSVGDDVKDLQYRLRALGFYADSVNGEYRTSTVNAVKSVQKELGIEQNGRTTPELLETIFSSDAPTAMEVTITEGMSGPIVRNLQTNLQTLCLYEGDIDGIYDVDVIESLRTFEQIYGYSASDAVSPTVQKALYYEAGKLSALFLDCEYTCSQTVESIPLATVSSSMRVRLRSKPSTESEALDKVYDGEQVLVLETGESWSKVQFGSNIGYIMNKYLNPTPWNLISATYSSTQSDQIYTIGVTMDSYRAGTPLPSTTFANYLANDGSLEDYEGVVDYATVNTGDDGTLLNLRATPSTNGDVIAELENSTQVKVLLKSAEWTLVECDAGSGYLKNDFLEYWQGPEDLMGDDAEESEVLDDYQETVYAVVQVSGGGNADVFDIDSEDATKIGYLPHNTQVTIVKADDSWSLIDFQGHQGYMHNENLKFILTEDAA